jgi:hypothetical protein
MTQNQSQSPNWFNGIVSMCAAALGAPWIGNAIKNMCWVADALYGEGFDDAEAARTWVSAGLQGDDADEFRAWQQEHGEAVAKALREDPEFKVAHEATYRELFDDFAAHGHEHKRKMKRQSNKSASRTGRGSAVIKR